MGKTFNLNWIKCIPEKTCTQLKQSILFKAMKPLQVTTKTMGMSGVAVVQMSGLLTLNIFNRLTFFNVYLERMK